MSSRGLDVLVLGGGVSGLASARILARGGARVELWEAGTDLGGLAAGFEAAGRSAERFYHYACASDTALSRWAAELGMALDWRRCGLGAWDGELSAFSSAADLWRLRRPWREKASLAWGLWRASRSQVAALEELEARDWLQQASTSVAAAQVLPLLDKKFGPGVPLSAAWLGRRLSRAASDGGLVGPAYGYLRGGYGAFFKALAEAAQAAGARLRLRRRAGSLRRERGVWRASAGARSVSARAVLAAIPSPRLAPLLPQPKGREEAAWRRRLVALRYRCLVQAVFLLGRPASPRFWLNLPGRDTPFCALVQMDHLRPEGPCLAYVPAYASPRDPVARWSDARVRREALAVLEAVAGRKIAPRQAWVFREALAQPLVPPGTLASRPSARSAYAGLYHLDAIHLYPDDRSLDACLRRSEELCAGILGAL